MRILKICLQNRSPIDGHNVSEDFNINIPDTNTHANEFNCSATRWDYSGGKNATPFLYVPIKVHSITHS